MKINGEKGVCLCGVACLATTMAAVNFSFSLKNSPKSFLSLPRPHLPSSIPPFSFLSPPPHTDTLSFHYNYMIIRNMGLSYQCWKSQLLQEKGRRTIWTRSNQRSRFNWERFQWKDLEQARFQSRPILRELASLMLRNKQGKACLSITPLRLDPSPDLRLAGTSLCIGLPIRPLGFFDVDSTGADLSDADLKGAGFSLANVTKMFQIYAGKLAIHHLEDPSSQEQTLRMSHREDQREYLCEVADGLNPAAGNDTRETLLCK